MCVCVCVCVLSRISSVLLFVTLTVAHQAPLSKGFSRQQYWSGLPSLPPGDPDPRIKPAYLCLWHSQAGSLPLAPPGKPYICVYIYIYIPIYIYICMYVCVYVYMYVYIYIQKEQLTLAGTLKFLISDLYASPGAFCTQSSIGRGLSLHWKNYLSSFYGTDHSFKNTYFWPYQNN